MISLQNKSRDEIWPALPFPEWSETCVTLHMWTQIVGKIRLALTPWTNHSWHVTLYVTARGAKFHSYRGVFLNFITRSCRSCMS